MTGVSKTPMRLSAASSLIESTTPSKFPNPAGVGYARVAGFTGRRQAWRLDRSCRGLGDALESGCVGSATRRVVPDWGTFPRDLPPNRTCPVTGIRLSDWWC